MGYDCGEFLVLTGWVAFSLLLASGGLFLLLRIRYVLISMSKGSPKARVVGGVDIGIAVKGLREI